MNVQMKKCDFKSNKEFNKSSFGNLQLASGSRDKTIKIWNTVTGACIQKLFMDILIGYGVLSRLKIFN